MCDVCSLSMNIKEEYTMHFPLTSLSIYLPFFSTNLRFCNPFDKVRSHFSRFEGNRRITDVSLKSNLTNSSRRRTGVYMTIYYARTYTWRNIGLLHVNIYARAIRYICR